jgi:hypothetical protein
MPQEEPADARPCLAIPYWSPGDTGEIRPLPSTVIWYMAGGIRTSTYQPGDLLEVVVDVRNSGGSNAPSLAQVTVWWSDPTLGFVIKPKNLIGFRQVAVPPRGGAASTAPMVKRMPHDAPDHICLIARVSHPLDPAPPIPSPVADRHWAQRNLSVVKVLAAAPAAVPFWVANPRADAATMIIRIAPARDPWLLVEADGVDGEPLTDYVALFTLDGDVFEGSLETEMTLEPGEARHLQVELEVRQLEPGRFAALEVSQTERDQVLGGLGIVLVADGR